MEKDVRGSLLLHLLDTTTMSPAAGAEVELTLYRYASSPETPPSTLRARADATGTLEMKIDEGELRIVSWSGSLVGGPASASITSGTTSELELELERGSEVCGLVRDARTGLAVAGAEVRFWTFSEEDVVRTDSDGTFRHPRFPVSDFAEQIQVRAAGYGRAVRYLRVSQDGTWELPDPLVEEGAIHGTGVPWVEVELVAEKRIRGSVLDPEGQPIAGASVRAEGYYHSLPDIASLDDGSATTDALGRFEVDGLRADIAHGLSIRVAGFAEAHAEAAADSAGTVQLDPIRLQRDLTIAGVVIDAEGVPVQDIRVLLRDTTPASSSMPEEDRVAGTLAVAFRTWEDGLETRTTPEGTFVFEGVREGRYSIALARDGEELAQLDLGSPATDAADFLEIRLPASCLTLRGTVSGITPDTTRIQVSRRGPSGDAEPVAWILPDAAGRFRVSGLDPFAPYELTAFGSSTESGSPIKLHGSGFAFEEIHLSDEPQAPLVGRELADLDLK